MTREKSRRAAYTLEYKLEAVRLVKGGQAKAVTAKVLGIPAQTLDNWVRLVAKGKLTRAGSKPVSAEQMELARLRAELARVKMERDILKNRPRGLPRPICLETSGAYTEGTPGQWPLAFWRRMSPSKNLAQGKLRTQLWWHIA